MFVNFLILLLRTFSFPDLRPSKDGKRDTYYFANGDNYTGDWIDDMMTGQGVYTWSSGAKYEGQFKTDRRHGIGTYYFSNGDRYVGNWVDGNMTGQGVMTFYGGDTYVGNWIDGQRNGKGIVIWSNGNHYMGDWVEDMRKGKGTMT